MTRTRVAAVFMLTLTVMALWFAVFHATGQLKVGLLIDVFFMGIATILALFMEKKRRDGKRIESILLRRGSKWPLVIGAACGALFWWLAFRFLPH